MQHKPSTSLQSNARGLTQLTVEAVHGVSHIAQSLHSRIAKPLNLGQVSSPSRGLTAFVYRSVRALTSAVGIGIEGIIDQLGEMQWDLGTATGRERSRSILNGILGDHLRAKNNPLAIDMQFRSQGKPLNPSQFQKQLAQCGGQIMILVHGACMNDLQWSKDGINRAEALAQSLGLLPVYLHYNSGLHISDNGQLFSDLIERLLDTNPGITRIHLLTHSMGGLVSRSACYAAANSHHGWLERLKSILFLGTPHQGAPLGKGASWLDLLLEMSPYSAPFAALGKIRSSGLSDLRYGSVVEADWQGRDRFEFNAPAPHVPELPKGVDCFFIAATCQRNNSEWGDKLIGDGLVTVTSALAQTSHWNLAESHQWIARDTNHMELLSDGGVYRQIKRWLLSVS